MMILTVFVIYCCYSFCQKERKKACALPACAHRHPAHYAHACGAFATTLPALHCQRLPLYCRLLRHCACHCHTSPALPRTVRAPFIAFLRILLVFRPATNRLLFVVVDCYCALFIPTTRCSPFRALRYQCCCSCGVFFYLPTTTPCAPVTPLLLILSDDRWYCSVGVCRSPIVVCY